MIAKSKVSLNGNIVDYYSKIDADLVFDAAKQKKKHRIKELLCIWSVLILPIIDLIIFWVYGTIQSIPIAFEVYDTYGNVARYGFDNFKYIFDTIQTPGNLFIESLTNNLKYWFLSIAVLTPISFVMGYFLYKKIWCYKIFRYVFFFPSLLSAVIISIFFKNIVGPQGQAQFFIEQLFGQKEVLLLNDSRFAMGTMLFYFAYCHLTGNLIYWLSAFSRIPDEIIEAAHLDGLNIVQEFIYIVFPITWPFLATMLMLMFTGILTTNGAALLLTGGSYGTYDLGYYEYVLTVSGTKSDQAISGVIGLLKGLVVLPFTLLINHFVSKIEPVRY